MNGADLFNAQATDPDGDALSWNLMLSWTPLFAADRAVTVRVTDPFGASDELSFVVPVDADRPPEVEVVVDTLDACAEVPYRVCVGVDDESAVTRTLTIDGAPQTLDALGCVTFDSGTPGTYVLEATATDTGGRVGSASATATLVTCEDGLFTDVPLVDILSPATGDRVAVPTDITATLTPRSGFEVSEWRTYAYASTTDGSFSPSQAILLASGTDADPVTVGSFDPTQLANGLWTIRVELDDTSLTRGIDEVAVVVAGEYKPGRFDVTFEDFVMPLPSTQLAMRRTYDTLDKDTVGDFGHGWSLEVTDFKVQTNGPLGEGGWSTRSCGGSFVHPVLCTERPNDPKVIAVTWPDGRVELFEFTPEPTPLVAAWRLFPDTTPMGDATSELRVSKEWPNWLGWNNWSVGNIYEVDFAGGGAEIYEPPLYELEDKFGNVYLIAPETEPDPGLRRVTDRYGNTIEVTETGLVLSNGPDLLWQRDSQDRITRLDLPDGERIAYTYDPVGDLDTVTWQDDTVDAFTYDAVHHLLEFGLQGRPPLRTVAYDAEGRVIREEDPGGVTRTYGYDPLHRTITSLGPDPGLTTTLVFNEIGRVGVMEERFDDGSGSLVTYRTERYYDTNNRMVYQMLPDGGEEYWDYDEDGNEVVYGAPNGDVTTTDYGPFGIISARFVNGLQAYGVTFDANDIPTRVTTADGGTTVAMERDTSGRLTAIEGGLGHRMELTYDALSFATRMEVFQPDGTLMLTSEVTVDGAGRPLSALMTSSTGATWTESRTYDPRGNLASITDGNGRTQTFVYGDQEELLTWTTSAGSARNYTYDDAVRLLTSTNAAGETLTYSWDAAGRVATIQGAGVDEAFTYDALGRMLEGRSGDHRLTATWDHRGPSSMGTAGPAPHATTTQTLTHDVGGRLARNVLTTGSGTTVRDVTLGWDAEGRLSSLTEATLGTFTFGFDNRGRYASVQRPGVGETAWIHDPLDRVTDMAHEGATIRGYAWSLFGTLEAITDDEGTHAVTSDDRGRVAGIDHPSTSSIPDESYTHDDGNRRVAWTNHGPADVVYDGADRLVQDATFTYGYDGEGRRTSRTDRITGDLTTYAWNAKDELVGVAEPDGTTWTYAYDVLGRRVLVQSRDAGGALTFSESYVYDMQDNVAAAFDETGALSRWWLSRVGFGSVLAEVAADGTPRFPILDHQRTPILWLDEAGQEGPRVRRTAYGERIAGAPTEVEPYGYTGHADDPTGLVWGRARYYDPQAGVWLSDDPMPMEPRTSYVRGQPLSATDPSGLSTAVERGGVIGFLQANATAGLQAALSSVQSAATATASLLNAGTLTAARATAILARSGIQVSFSAASALSKMPPGILRDLVVGTVVEYSVQGGFWALSNVLPADGPTLGALQMTEWVTTPGVKLAAGVRLRSVAGVMVLDALLKDDKGFCEKAEEEGIPVGGGDQRPPSPLDASDKEVENSAYDTVTGADSVSARERAKLEAYRRYKLVRGGKFPCPRWSEAFRRLQGNAANGNRYESLVARIVSDSTQFAKNNSTLRSFPIDGESVVVKPDFITERSVVEVKYKANGTILEPATQYLTQQIEAEIGAFVAQPRSFVLVLAADAIWTVRPSNPVVEEVEVVGSILGVSSSEGTYRWTCGPAGSVIDPSVCWQAISRESFAGTLLPPPPSD